jgi:hypothetical protein
MGTPVQPDPRSKYGTHQQLAFGPDVPKLRPESHGKPAPYQHEGNRFGNSFLDSVKASKGARKYFEDRVQRIDPRQQENQADNP